jgi:hypothetical protein
MTVALLAISDGRDEYHHQALRSVLEHLPAFEYYVFVEDPDHTLGFGGAIQEGWRQVLQTDARHVFHLELDFIFDRTIPVADMVEVLETHPHLVQMALLRQPWNDQERAAGSVANLLANDLMSFGGWGARWLEHRRYFTTNPCVYSRWVAERGWPGGAESEGHFGIGLFASNPTLRAAFWGQGEEWCIHIGDERTGSGY